MLLTRVCYSQFLRVGGPARHTGPLREAPASVRRKKESGESLGKACIVDFAGRDERGRVSS